jgi:hypothetical protein
VFAFVPKPFQLPNDIYGLTVGLRRVLESSGIPDTLGDVTENVDAAAAAKETPGLIRSLLRNLDNMGQLLTGSLPLGSFVQRLATALKVDTMPPPTDEGLEDLFGILRTRLNVANAVRGGVREYIDNVQALVLGLGESIPSTLGPLADKLKLLEPELLKKLGFNSAPSFQLKDEETMES